MVFPEHLKLTHGYRIGLCGVLFRKESEKIFKKAARNVGRQFYRFARHELYALDHYGGMGRGHRWGIAAPPNRAARITNSARLPRR
jgi:hypothetical protein